MSGVENRHVSDSDIDVRLDRWLRRSYPGLTQGKVEKLLRTGQIRVDGHRAKAAHRLSAGQVIRVPPLALSDNDGAGAGRTKEKRSRNSESRPEDAARLKEMILYRDDDVIVLNKPAGLAAQGGTGISRSVDGMLGALADGNERPKLVHRLDRDTAGVLVLARSTAVARQLSSAFRGRSVRKIYWAITRGIPDPAEGVIDAPLGKSGGSRERMEVDEADGRRAVTLYRTIDRAGKIAAWVALWPRTGRTHQLRAHCAAIGTPILGDGKYGGSAAFIEGDGLARKVHLLARRVVLPHPSGRGVVDVTAPVPDHMAAAFETFGLDPREAPADPFPEET
jgi:23S rRNA pseudouridine955/2504/2580 synthase